MKNLFLALSLLLAPCTLHLANAQEQIRVFKDGSSTRFTTSELTFSDNGATLSVADSTYDTAQLDSITVVHTVTVTFSDETATVDLGHAPDVTFTTDGAHVSILSTNTRNELEFVLQGQSTQGSLTYDGPLKCKFYLNGLNLTSNRGAAIDIQCGKRVDLVLVSGTQNVLADAAGGEQKAALYCKGHLEVEGGGSLTVTGNAKHGIATKEYMQLKRSTGIITVNKAVSDAMHVGQYFLMSGGSLVIEGQGADGLQVEKVTLADDITPDPNKENNGQLFIRGGSINIKVAKEDVKGIKVPDDMTVSGGTFGIIASGDGSKGISVGGNMLINQDTGTTLMQIVATGGIYEDEETEEESRCMGIKVDGNLTVNAGAIYVTNTGSGSRGIRVHGTYTKATGATVQANIKQG